MFIDDEVNRGKLMSQNNLTKIPKIPVQRLLVSVILVVSVVGYGSSSRGDIIDDNQKTAKEVVRELDRFNDDLTGYLEGTNPNLPQNYSSLQGKLQALKLKPNNFETNPKLDETILPLIDKANDEKEDLVKIIPPLDVIPKKGNGGSLVFPSTQKETIKAIQQELNTIQKELTIPESGNWDENTQNKFSEVSTEKAFELTNDIATIQYLIAHPEILGQTGGQSNLLSSILSLLTLLALIGAIVLIDRHLRELKKESKDLKKSLFASNKDENLGGTTIQSLPPELRQNPASLTLELPPELLTFITQKMGGGEPNPDLARQIADKVTQQVKSPSLDDIKNAVKSILPPVSQNKAENMPDIIQQFIIDELQKNNTLLLNQLTPLINKPSTQEFRQEEHLERPRQQKQEAEKSSSGEITLTEEEKSIVENYNARKDLSQWTTSVSTTKDSELSARAGSGKLAVLTEDTMGTYWLVTGQQGLYLVLNYNKKLNALQMDSVGELFELRNYPQKNNDPNQFKLLKPGKVSISSDNKTWELGEKGVLDFKASE